MAHRANRKQYVRAIVVHSRCAVREGRQGILTLCSPSHPRCDWWSAQRGPRARANGVALDVGSCGAAGRFCKLDCDVFDGRLHSDTSVGYACPRGERDFIKWG